ncbi:Oidioi.mRNA.OKI2018_I69.PAR.g9171.t1.cds [Oikopleura dioica]|uniref:Oidioi.mRNA.OKI2018_I69.PAR.g9171.t1.cds n=1 Tax=Oikopleura dioica TaxID=34765 RepID=A0ABN7RJB2_OIKDI|nr:Oidioi.mRNA.OKI2018_I69.PAR.g9171.t1.cds [Oikopleura dioica]
MKLSLAIFAVSDACSNELLSQQCDNDCIASYLDCQTNCLSDGCNLQCENNYKSCFNNCPCGGFCPKGCENCPSEYCYDPLKKTVVVGQRFDQTDLTASYFVGENSLEQVDAFSPKINQIYFAGSVFFKGELWIFGGYPDGNKISILGGCNFEEQQTRLKYLFSTERHALTLFEENVWLCFGNARRCEIFDGETSVLDDQNVNVARGYDVALGVYDQQLIAVGGYGVSRGKVELRDEQKWRLIEDHPVDIAYTEVISFKRGILTLGGTSARVDDMNEDGYEVVKGIYRLEDYVWSQVGELQHANMLGKAALNGNELLFIPGLKQPWVVQKFRWNEETEWLDENGSYETGQEGYTTFPLVFDSRAVSCELF